MSFRDEMIGTPCSPIGTVIKVNGILVEGACDSDIRRATNLELRGMVAQIVEVAQEYYNEQGIELNLSYEGTWEDSYYCNDRLQLEPSIYLSDGLYIGDMYLKGHSKEGVYCTVYSEDNDSFYMEILL